MPEARRSQIASLLESCPFWTFVGVLTVIDLVIFSFQMFVPQSSALNPILRLIEFIISSTFVVELGFRCYSSETEQLTTAVSLIDASAVLLSFILCLATVSTPLLAARSARLVRIGSASSRCGRNAVNSSRSAVEMRAFFSNARRSGAGYAKRVRRETDSVTALFIDLTGAPELRALLSDRPWLPRKPDSMRPRGIAVHEMPILAAAATLPRLAKTEIDKADAAFLRARTSTQERDKTPEPTTNPLLASGANTEEQSDPERNIKDSQDPLTKKQDRRLVTSVKALLAIFDHALSQAKANDAPPPRLLNTLRHKEGVSLCFLNREI